MSVGHSPRTFSPTARGVYTVEALEQMLQKKIKEGKCFARDRKESTYFFMNVTKIILRCKIFFTLNATNSQRFLDLLAGVGNKGRESEMEGEGKGEGKVEGEGEWGRGMGKGNGKGEWERGRIEEGKDRGREGWERECREGMG